MVNEALSFGLWLKRRRRGLGLTQRDLARQVGYAEVTLRKVEAEELRPSRQMAERLAEHLEIPPDQRVRFIRFARDESVDDTTFIPTETASLHAPAETRPAGAPPNALSNHPATVSEEATHRRLANLPLDRIPPVSPLAPVSRMPLRVNPFFVGRKREFYVLASRLKENGALVGVNGLGGMGKTQLAVEFVHRYGTYFAGGVFWLNFSDPDSIPAEVAVCGGAGHLEVRSGFSSLTLDEQIRLVQAAWQSPVPRLLVFDNCEDEGLLEQWHPKTGGCRVLVTSRRMVWEPTLGMHVLGLGVLKRAESVTLLHHFRRDLSANDPGLEAIAIELGDLPLALHLAGNFLVRYRHTFNATIYHDTLRRSDLLLHPSLRGHNLLLSPTHHDLHVGRTFAISYERLDHTTSTDALALQVLACAAYFAPGVPIPHALLGQASKVDDSNPIDTLRLDDALHRLLELGLIDQEVEGAYHLHTLLVAFVLMVSTDPEALPMVEQVLTETASRLTAEGYATPVLTLQSHLRVAVSRAAARGDERAAALSHVLGTHLHLLGDYAGAQKYYERGLAIRKRLVGDAHLLTAESLSHLGWLMTQQGNFVAARYHLERALAIREATLGPEDIAIAETLNALGMMHGYQREHTVARTYLERALTIRKAVLGKDHPLTAESLNHLGVVLKIQEEYEGSRQVWQEALAIWEAALGPHHPNIARVFNNLGLLLQQEGKFEEARSHFLRALEVWEVTLGPEHPNIAATYLNLGGLFKDQGFYEEGEPYLQRALTIFEQTLGIMHVNSAVAMNMLGEVRLAQGNLGVARDCFTRALAVFEHHFGELSPYSQLARKNIATVSVVEMG